MIQLTIFTTGEIPWIFCECEYRILDLVPVQLGRRTSPVSSVDDNGILIVDKVPHARFQHRNLPCKPGELELDITSLAITCMRFHMMGLAFPLCEGLPPRS